MVHTAHTHTCTYIVSLPLSRCLCLSFSIFRLDSFLKAADGPKVLRNAGLDPAKVHGWAFGLGLERLAMVPVAAAGTGMVSLLITLLVLDAVLEMIRKTQEP